MERDVLRSNGDFEALKMKKHIVHFVRAFGYSLAGLAACFKDEVAFRQECLIAIPHFLAAVLLPLPMWVRAFLSLLWVLLVTVELLNTAIEAVVNLVSPDRHSLAKKAKDCGSAAVFCISLSLVVTWVCVLAWLVRTKI